MTNTHEKYRNIDLGTGMKDLANGACPICVWEDEGGFHQALHTNRTQ